MALDMIKPGIEVFTAHRTRAFRGRIVYLGGSHGTVESLLRHPVSRRVTGVILDVGTGDRSDNLVVPATALRMVEAV